MLWLIYEILFFLGVLLTGPYYLLRMRRRGGYARNFGERFGRYSEEARARIAALSRPVWVHAVSVGEVQLALPLIDQLRQRYPDQSFLLTTTTSTGYVLAKEWEDERIAVVYYPMDSRFFFSKIHQLTRPRALLLMEAELWPNHLLYCKRRGIPLALVNARMSDRSYPRYLKLKPLFSRVLAAFSLITLQSEVDRERLLRLGARAGSLRVIGSLKYAAARAVDDEKRERLLGDLDFLQRRPVLVGASTHAGEEELLLEAWKELRHGRPELALVLAPRHVERKCEIVEMLQQHGVEFSCRSNPEAAHVVLLDTTGDLRYVYELASVVFIGKSLCGVGGQNLMEPAWYGKAIVFGPNMQNFRPIVEDFLQSEAAVQIDSAENLIPVLSDLLNGAGEAYGLRAKELVDSKQDVMERTVSAIDDMLADQS
jgi:3-deoxy-D-manno-octulosonic-acid transferase